MNNTNETSNKSLDICIAFEDNRRIAMGAQFQVALAVKQVVDQGDHGAVLVFDAESSRPIDFDLRGTAEEIQQRLARPQAEANPSPRGRGRPKLGVVGREVTLLPRHWDWLASQPGGASVTLRKLVDQARKAHTSSDQKRGAQESAYRFLSAMAGNQPGFEEAIRALFANQAEAFHQHIARWPTDVRDHARTLAARAFPEDGRAFPEDGQTPCVT